MKKAANKAFTEDITIAGIGPGQWNKLTIEVEEILRASSHIFFRDPFNEVYEKLKRSKGKKVINLLHLYFCGATDFDDVYNLITDTIVKSSKLYGHVVLALAGNPSVFEITTELIRYRARERGISVRVVEGLSCLDTIFVEHRIDPILGLQLINGILLAREGNMSPDLPALIFHIGSPLSDFGKAERNTRRIMEILLNIYPPGHPVSILRSQCDSYSQERINFELGRLADLEAEIHAHTTLYVPPLKWMTGQSEGK